MTTTKKTAQNNVQNNGNNVQTTTTAQVEKKRSFKCLANDAAKIEQFSKKQCLNMVKIAFDNDAETKDARAYILGLGFTAGQFKQLTWQDLDIYIETKNPAKCSTWAVLNGLRKYSDAFDLKGEKKARAEKAAERAAAKAARARMEEKKKAEKEKARAEKAARPVSAEMLQLEAKIIEKEMKKQARRAAKK